MIFNLFNKQLVPKGRGGFFAWRNSNHILDFSWDPWHFQQEGILRGDSGPKYAPGPHSRNTSSSNRNAVFQPRCFLAILFRSGCEVLNQAMYSRSRLKNNTCSHCEGLCTCFHRLRIWFIVIEHIFLIASFHDLHFFRAKVEELTSWQYFCRAIALCRPFQRTLQWLVPTHPSNGTFVLKKCRHAKFRQVFLHNTGNWDTHFRDSCWTFWVALVFLCWWLDGFRVAFVWNPETKVCNTLHVYHPIGSNSSSKLSRVHHQQPYCWKQRGKGG